MTKPPLTLNDGIGSENFNTQIIMKKDLNTLGLFIQLIASSSNPFNEGKLILFFKGIDFSFQIDNPDDLSLVCLLSDDLQGTNANKKSFDQLVRILRRYDLEETIKMLKHIDEKGLMWEVIGDSYLSSNPTTAMHAYDKAIMEGNNCGLCKLGRCYAEGRGCEQDLSAARECFWDVSEECYEAYHFLDWYGLR